MMVKERKSTLDNDGSVSDDPCQACDGRLVLRNVQSGGWFLGCSNYPKGCTFKMAPNSEELGELEEARAIRRELREKKRAESDAQAKLELEEARRRAQETAPKFCEGCFSRLSNVDVQAGRAAHKGC
jgi:ssDNA-binding Zn-finger/Zn-ribbon topoisomerase 1